MKNDEPQMNWNKNNKNKIQEIYKENITRRAIEELENSKQKTSMQQDVY